jgi:hypothetical protein
MKQTKTLAQVANDIENRENLNEYQNNETAIKMGSFDSFADFLGYYRQHYRPMLEKVASGFTPTGNDAHLLRFLASDLLDALKEDNESDEEGETVAVVVLTFTDADNFKKAQRFFDSDGPSQFWASDWDEQARTIEFVEGNDPDALGAALIEEMQAEGITGYTWQAFRQNID